MSTFFDDVLGNLNDIQQDYLGPDYKYWAQINSPSEMGMSGDGNLGALANDVAGLVGYVQLLVSGGGAASKVAGPLGNKFFLKTGAKCKDKDSGRDTDRYIYVNNIPTGNIPFISYLLDQNFKDMRGLVPGVIEDIGKINPLTMFQAFMMGNKPTCVPLTMDVVDANNNVSQQTHFVTEVDIKNMDPCIFPNKTNPLTNQGCKYAFQNMIPNGSINSNIPDDIISKLFFAGFGGLLLYILYLIIQRTNRLNKK